MAEALLSVGQASKMGLTSTSNSPPPSAYTTTASKIPTNGSAVRSAKSSARSARSCKAVGQQNRRPVANPVNEPGRQQIYTQLDEKIHSDQQGNLCSGTGSRSGR